MLDRPWTVGPQAEPSHPTSQSPSREEESKLRVPHTKEPLTNAIDSKLFSLSLIGTDIGNDWVAFRDAVYYAAKDKIGVARRKHKDWFDENEKIHCLLQEKHIHHKALLTDPKSVRKKALFDNSMKSVQREL